MLKNEKYLHNFSSPDSFSLILVQRSNVYFVHCIIIVLKY